MISKGSFYVCVVSYEKTMEDGTQKKVSERYVVKAESFSDAETKVVAEIASFVTGELTVKDITCAPYKEVVFADSDDTADRFYKVKVHFIFVSEKTKKEQKTPCFYLVQADNAGHVQKLVADMFRGTLVDYSVAMISETRIVDIFI